MALPCPDKGAWLHQPQYDIHILQGVLSHIDHVFAQLVLGFVDARRVHKYDLSPVIRVNGLYPVPGGLGLVGRNCDLLADQMVHQGGFAHIGPPDQCHKA